MGKIRRWGTLLVIGVGLTLASSSASADYVVSVVETGTQATHVVADNSLADAAVSLDVVLDSATGDVHDSFALTMFFSKPGLMYDFYNLASPEYTATGAGDWSLPAGGSIGASIYWEGLTGEEAGVPYTFGSGTLISLGLTVPMGFEQGPILIDIGDEWDYFYHGSTERPFVPGQTFTLEVVPEPATLALLALGGVAVLRRRRK